MECINAITELIKALAEFSWPVTIVGLVYWFRKPISDVLRALKDQISRGATLKYGEIQLNGISLSDFPLAESSFFSIVAADQDILTKRNQNYSESKNIFLVHRLKNTGRSHQALNMPVFDVSVYLVGHKQYGSLNDVRLVEYYFGKFFKEDPSHVNGTKFVVKNSRNGFAVLTDAYGPTLCEVRVEFHDGTSTFMSRYIDFEGTDYRFDMQSAIKADERNK